MRRQLVNVSNSYSSPNRTFRFILLLAIALCLGMIFINTFRYRPLLGMPGGLASVMEPTTLLCLLAVLIWWATGRGGHLRQVVISKGALFGLISGGIEALHIVVENFAGFSGRTETISTGIFMLTMFLLWGAAGFHVTRGTAAPGSGMLAGSWSALVGMLITATFGLALLSTFMSRLELRNVGSPDLMRSGWTDLRAFTIADSFEAVVKVLIIGPVIGAIFGGIGGLIARQRLTPTRRGWTGAPIARS